MMKISRTICAASLIAAGAMCLQSCSSSEDETSAAPVKITVETMPMTRLAYADQDSFMMTKWIANDALRIVPSNGSASQVFTLESGAGTTTGTFSGTTVDVGTGTYTVLYPSTLTSMADFDTFSYSGQQQDGDGSVAALAAFHSIKLVSTTSDYSTFSLTNAEQSSVMAMTFKNILSSVGTPQQITLSADESCFGTTNSSVANEVSLKLVNMKQTGSIKAYMMLGANTNKAKLSLGKKLTVKITGDKGVCYHVFKLTSDIVFAGGKRNNINVSNWSTSPDSGKTTVTSPVFANGVTLDDTSTPQG